MTRRNDISTISSSGMAIAKICLAIVVIATVAWMSDAAARENPYNRWDVRVIRDRGGVYLFVGAIIGVKAILVPAQSAIGLNPADIKVLVGASPDRIGKRLKVERIIIHPAFVTSSEENNVAILVLSSQLLLDETEQIVRLPPEAEWQAPADAQIYCSGWTTYSGLLNVLLNVVIRVVSEIIDLLFYNGENGCPRGCICGRSCIADVGASVVAVLPDRSTYILGQALETNNCRALAARTVFSYTAHTETYRWLTSTLLEIV